MDRVLIVDDNPKNIQFLGSVLSEFDYEIEYAQDGMEALSIIESESFDLILMDVMMPKLDGFETCKHIKTMPDRKDIPVMFLTAKTDSESITTAFECGGIDYVSKPFNQIELLARVRTHIKLKKTSGKLENLNKELEQKVEERTHDLSEANQKLQQANNELKIVDETKSKFLQLISNEIKKPLNGIIGPLQLLKNSINNDHIINLVQMLDISVHRLEMFYKDTALITDIKTNAYTSEATPFNAFQLVELELIELGVKISEKSIGLDLDLFDETLSLNTDKNLFQKIIQRILFISFENTASNKILKICTHVTDSFKGIEFSYTGTPFNKSLFETDLDVFESLHNIDDETTGIGFDIYLINLMMNTIGGQLTFSNQKNDGSKIILTF